MNPDEKTDPELQDLFRRAADQLLDGYDKERVHERTERFLAEGERRRTRRRRYIFYTGGMIAASILVTALLFRFWPNPTERSGGTNLVEAPPIQDIPAGQLAGHDPAPEPNAVNIVVPAIPVAGWVSVLQMQDDGPPILRTATDRSCYEIEKNQPRRLETPFTRDAKRGIRVLVVWSEHPSGSALAQGLRDGEIKSFGVEDERRLLEEVASLVNKGGNRLIMYRFHTIGPRSERKGN